MVKTVRIATITIFFGLLFWVFYPSESTPIKPLNLPKNALSIEPVNDSTSWFYHMDREQSIVYRVLRVNQTPKILQISPVIFVKDSIYKLVNYTFNPQKLTYPIHINLEDNYGIY